MTVIVPSSNPVPVVNIHSLPAAGGGGGNSGGNGSDGSRAVPPHQQMIQQLQQSSTQALGLSIPIGVGTVGASSTAAALAAAKKSDHLHAKHVSRIQSLERTIEYMQDQHSATLKSLHDEIERLQNLVADLILRSSSKDEMDKPHGRRRSAISIELGPSGQRRTSFFRQALNSVTGGGNGGGAANGDIDSSKMRGSEQADILNRVREWALAEGDYKAAARSHNAGGASGIERMFGAFGASYNHGTLGGGAGGGIGGIGGSLAGAAARSTIPAIGAGTVAGGAASGLYTRGVAEQQQKQQQQQQQQQQHPLYILVERERKKYQGILERMNDESKRKQAEIDQLRHEISLVREVLAMAGLKFDVKEFQSIVQARQAHDKKRGPAGAGAGPAPGVPAAVAGAAAGATQGQPQGMMQKYARFGQHAQHAQQSAGVDLRAKIAVLPPISKRDYHADDAAGEMAAAAAAFGGAHGVPVLRVDSSAIGGGVHPDDTHIPDSIAPPAADAPLTASGNIRSQRYRLHRDAADNPVPIEHGDADADGSVAAMDVFNPNTDYNHRAHLAYGGFGFDPVDEDATEMMTEIDGFVEAAPTEDNRSELDPTPAPQHHAPLQQPQQQQKCDQQQQQGGPHGNALHGQSPPQRRRVRVPSNTASILSGGSTLRGSDLLGEPVALPRPFGDALPPVRSLKGTPQGPAQAGGRDRVFGAAAADPKTASLHQQPALPSQQPQQPQPQAQQQLEGTKAASKSGYVGRLLKAKIVRERQFKDARDRTT
ncbi:hypothetical protein HK105_202094 [Polyrhizophydium stewartii]|uniref:CCDC92/74 N-terminal domain-containing protein n=1 Tax=Polyrhizophydium stewartii TaxID=2732419 RepID=A0ABR4NF75_9FUNG